VPVRPELIQEVKDVLGNLEGVGQVEVQITLSPPWTPDRMTERPATSWECSER